MSEKAADLNITDDLDRRQVLKRLGTLCVALALPLAAAGCGGQPTDWRPKQRPHPNRHRGHGR